MGVKGLLYKQEDVSLDPQHLRKELVVAAIPLLERRTLGVCWPVITFSVTVAMAGVQ